MNSTPIALAAIVSALIAGTASAQTADTDGPKRLDDAQLAYENCHWQEAFAAFAALADHGQPEAARIAVLMQRHGPALYHITFLADAEKVRRWSLLATTSAP